MQVELFDGTKLDTRDAPAGYFAELKADAKPSDGGNICRACDWRPSCHSGPINEMPRGQNCRGHELTGLDGRLYARADGCSVVFKRLTPNYPHERP